MNSAEVRQENNLPSCAYDLNKTLLSQLFWSSHAAILKRWQRNVSTVKHSREVIGFSH